MRKIENKESRLEGSILTMRTITDITFDEERALYNLKDTEVNNWYSTIMLLQKFKIDKLLNGRYRFIF